MRASIWRMVLFDVALLVVFTFILSRMACISVEQAGKLSDYFGLSRMAIGMLIVGVMVSLPELSVAITSSASGQGELSAGNVFGANVVLSSSADFARVVQRDHAHWSKLVADNPTAKD